MNVITVLQLCQPYGLIRYGLIRYMYRCMITVCCFSLTASSGTDVQSLYAIIQCVPEEAVS